MRLNLWYIYDTYQTFVYTVYVKHIFHYFAILNLRLIKIFFALYWQADKTEKICISNSETKKQKISRKDLPVWNLKLTDDPIITEVVFRQLEMNIVTKEKGTKTRMTGVSGGYQPYVLYKLSKDQIHLWNLYTHQRTR